MKLFLCALCFLVNSYSYCQSNLLSGSYVNKFKRFEQYELYSGIENKEWQDIAWKGERINKQIVLWSKNDIEGVTYQLTDLVSEYSKISSSEMSLKFQKYVNGDPKARGCEEKPNRKQDVYLADALSIKPIDKIRFNDPIKLWLSINVPSNVSTGIYKGNLLVTTSDNEQISFKIILDVLDLQLPPVKEWTFHLDLWQFPNSALKYFNENNPVSNHISPYSKEHLALLKPTYKLLENSGQKVITAYIKDQALNGPTMVKWILKKDGVTWEYDFSKFDYYVETLMSWGIKKQINAHSPVGWNKNVLPFWSEKNGNATLSTPIGSKLHSERWDHFLTHFKLHLEKKNWFDKTVIYFDEIPESDMISLVGLIKKNSIDWKIGLAHSHAVSQEVRDKIYDLSGLYGYGATSNDKINSKNVRTFYTSCTQLKPNNYLTRDNSSAELTWMAWHAFNGGYDGYLRWAYDFWIDSSPLSLHDGQFTAGDFSFIYRNPEKEQGILSSIRLEMLREGIQDYEKIKELKTKKHCKKTQVSLNTLTEKFSEKSGSNHLVSRLVESTQKELKSISKRFSSIDNCEMNE